MTEQFKGFDALDWIDQYFAGRAKLNFDQLRPVLCFSLIWNLFETVACHRKADPNSIRQAVDQAVDRGRLSQVTYVKYVEYFRSRYLHDGNIDHVFAVFILDHERSKAVVRGVLLDEMQDLNNIVYALLLIANRVRNNLFHGNKRLETLHTQTELFHVVNSLLATFLEDFHPGQMPHLQREAENIQ
ncbi:MAG: hypothetical protein ABI977_04875 [Acidobacteriota bacterium]